MDQIKIGKFIAEERKAKKYTQRELADKLSISDKTISKWERGNGFPEVSLLLPLCNELEITVNELLSGERLQAMDYKKKAEENMVNLVKEAQESKKKIIMSAMVSVLVIVAAVPLFVVAGMFEMQIWTRVLLMGIGFVIMVMGIAIACVLDREAGAFECPECKERFVPDMKSYVMGPHTITKRKLTCPKCGCTKYCIESRAIEYILRNPVYIGKLRWNPAGRTKRNFSNENIIISNSRHEAIVSEKIFNQAQNILDGAKKGTPVPGQKRSVRAWISGLV